MVIIPTLPTPLLRDPDIHRMVLRLAQSELTDDKIEWLAVAIYKRIGWAGRPIDWEYATKAIQNEYLLNAQAVLFGAKLALES